MNLKSRLILEDYRRQRESFIKLGDVVHNMLSDIAKDLGLTVLAVEHRVKEERSLAGKLERKGDLYNSFEDVTDILGCRVICFLSDEVDKIGKKVEEKFVIDWEKSSDSKHSRICYRSKRYRRSILYVLAISVSYIVTTLLTYDNRLPHKNI